MREFLLKALWTIERDPLTALPWLVLLVLAGYALVRWL